jgi:hypothetical protein
MILPPPHIPYRPPHHPERLDPRLAFGSRVSPSDWQRHKQPLTNPRIKISNPQSSKPRNHKKRKTYKHKYTPYHQQKGYLGRQKPRRIYSRRAPHPRSIELTRPRIPSRRQHEDKPHIPTYNPTTMPSTQPSRQPNASSSHGPLLTPEMLKAPQLNLTTPPTTAQTDKATTETGKETYDTTTPPPTPTPEPPTSTTTEAPPMPKEPPPEPKSELPHTSTSAPTTEPPPTTMPESTSTQPLPATTTSSTHQTPKRLFDVGTYLRSFVSAIASTLRWRHPKKIITQPSHEDIPPQ